MPTGARERFSKLWLVDKIYLHHVLETFAARFPYSIRLAHLTGSLNKKSFLFVLEEIAQVAVYLSVKHSETCYVFVLLSLFYPVLAVFLPLFQPVLGLFLPLFQPVLVSFLPLFQL